MLSAVAYFFQKLIQPLKFIILICLIISIVLTPFNRVNAKENDSSLKDNEIHARFAVQPRFDVIEIYAPDGTQTLHPEIHHLEDAFQ